ncbi:PREDICTED: uncharacterized protein LOC105517868 [Colobus angolensis palliatus]|uniref:uncharacterized protein LOC105517868 n=1 Tax=Colobus angolensis palliatus TaxID=336983 RepID=UPI0005F48B36|nr:PREDICTED: uncharacterized protein LOC105517868 [Colobus angolensis palliatus]
MGNVVQGRDAVNPATIRAKAFFAPSLVLAVSLELTHADANSPSECREDETLTGQFNLYMGDKLEGETNGRRVKRKLNDRANTPNSNPGGYRRVNNDRYDFVEGNVL